MPENLPRVRTVRCAPDAGFRWGEAASWQELGEPVFLRDTVTGEAPDQATSVRTAWNATHWYVCFENTDQNPWATFRTRDARLWDEEAAEVFVDSVGDLDSYLEIQINPLGVTKEVVIRRGINGLKKEFGWELDGLRGAVERMATGWTAVLAIPFAGMGANRPEAGSIWRVNFLRIDRPAGPGTTPDLSAWSPTGVRQFHRPERFGWIEFQ